jgi:mycothiol maleylpyruvate isomerase-like protein
LPFSLVIVPSVAGMTTPTLPVAETVRLLTADRDLLLDHVRDRAADELTRPYLVRGGPLGDFCESLRDLVAHVLMWDEINLAVLTEANLGRAHWSLAASWETAEAGRELNRSGVAAGRELPVSLLLHRFTSVSDALLDELGRHDDEAWARPAGVRPGSVGELVQYVMTVPGNEPYRHAAIHLGVGRGEVA